MILFITCLNCNETVCLDYSEAKYPEGTIAYSECPNCGVTTTFEFPLENYPKAEPQTNPAYFWKIKHVEREAPGNKNQEELKPEEPTSYGKSGHDKPSPDTDREHREEKLSPVQEGNPSIHQRANRLADLISEGLAEVSEIEAELAHVADVFADQFISVHKTCESLSRWEMMDLTNFMLSPYCVFPCGAETKDMEFYSRWLLSPKFHQDRYGFPVESRGGFYLQAITPYSRLAHPLDNNFLELMDIPDVLDLHVMGNKIVGNDLLDKWDEIPSVEPDYGHTENDPSIVIKGNWMARRWLARKGIMPWYPESRTDRLDKPGFYYNCVKGTKYERVVNRLAENGRMVYLNSDPAEYYMAAAMCDGSIDIPSIFLAPDRERVTAWQKISSNVRSFYSKRITSKSWNEVESYKYLNQFRMIIVDASDPIPEDIVPMLYEFQGVLLILTNDPIMDCFEENEAANSVYGLAASVMDDIRLSVATKNVCRSIVDDFAKLIKKPFGYQGY